MPSSPIAHAVFIEGPDALAFAHSQFTSQVTSLANEQWQFSSWLDAQGRVRNLFHLLRLADDRLLLILRGGRAEDLVDALRRFVFRSRIKLSPAHGLLASGTSMDMYTVGMQGDIIRLGCGTYSMLFGTDVSADDAWQQQQLQQGWPWLPDSALGELLPPALSLHRLGAIALDKGCYPGQEIVARLHYRGGNKRHLHLVALSKPANDGILLHRDEREFVRLLNVIAHDERIEALAVISDAEIEQLANHENYVSNDGIDVTLLNSWPA